MYAIRSYYAEGARVDVLAQAAVGRRDEAEAIRQRMKRETERLEKFGIQGFVETLLPALDSFDHGLAVV